MFTNSEYLEARFGKIPRVVSVIVQLQYRANILGAMSIALHLLFMHVLKLDSTNAWILVLGLAAYPAWLR